MKDTRRRRSILDLKMDKNPDGSNAHNKPDDSNQGGGYVTLSKWLDMEDALAVTNNQ